MAVDNRSEFLCETFGWFEFRRLRERNAVDVREIAIVARDKSVNNLLAIGSHTHDHVCWELVLLDKVLEHSVAIRNGENDALIWPGLLVDISLRLVALIEAILGHDPNI